MSFTKSENQELSFKEILEIFKEWSSFLITKWAYCSLLGFFFGVGSYYYASKQEISYEADLTFVVEENKSSGSSLSGLASLAGQFGVDVSGGSNGSLFSGDNILLYLRSHSLSKSVLLNKFENSDKLTLADYYADVYGLSENWSKTLGKISFTNYSKSENNIRVYDSLLQQIVARISNKHFFVEKPDKKAGFITIKCLMKDEKLAKTYCESIAKEAVAQYVEVKIKRQKSTVVKLQSRVDSIARLLNNVISKGANLQSSNKTMDINPLYGSSSIISTETTMRDKSLLSSIYVSALQNLELAKFTLSQETPVIQIIDLPIYPLQKTQISKLKYSVIGFSLGIFLTLLFFVSQKIITNSLKKN